MEDPSSYSTLNLDSMMDAQKTLRECENLLNWKYVGGEHVMDVGCGPGNLTATVLRDILPNGSSIIGCDISEETVKYANGMFAEDMLAFEVLDLCDPDMRRRRGTDVFDKVFSFYCFHNISNPKLALENTCTLLKPGGQLFFLTPAQHPTFQLREMLKQIPKYDTYTKNCDLPATYVQEDPVLEHTKLMKSVGLQVDDCFLKKSEFTFPSLDEYIRLFQIVNRFVHDMPKNLREELSTDLKRLIEQYNLLDIDGDTVRSNYSLLVMIATKPWK